jgi:hypothetical protein
MFLRVAGWGNPDDASRYVVRIEGNGVTVLPLHEVLRRAISNRVWLVTERFGEPDSRSERPLVAVVGSDGVGDVRVRDVRRMLVIPAESKDIVQDRDFTRLAAYRGAGGGRILWNEYFRLDGIAVMVGTWSVNGDPDKAAVLLSEQIAGWSDERLLEFLAARAGLRIHPEAAVERHGDYTAVRLRRFFEEAPIRKL